jgi:hypothetical protein
MNVMALPVPLRHSLPVNPRLMRREACQHAARNFRLPAGLMARSYSRLQQIEMEALQPGSRVVMQAARRLIA